MRKIALLLVTFISIISTISLAYVSAVDGFGIDNPTLPHLNKEIVSSDNNEKVAHWVGALIKSGTISINPTTLYMTVGNGATFTATNGYVATASGSIIGISGHSSISSNIGSNSLEWCAFINGAEAFCVSSGTFSSNIEIAGNDTQAEGIDTFVRGDEIQIVIIGHPSFGGFFRTNANFITAVIEYD